MQHSGQVGNNLRTCLSSDISGGHLWGQTLRIHQSQAASPVWSVRPTNQHATSESGKAKLLGTKNETPEPTAPDSEMQRHGGPKRPKTDLQNKETQRHGGPKRSKKKRPQSPPLKTAKRSGTAGLNGQKRTKNLQNRETQAPNEPKTHQKRSVTAAENGASGTAFGKAHTNSWAGLGLSGLS